MRSQQELTDFQSDKGLNLYDKKNYNYPVQIRRILAHYIDPHVTDEHIARAIADPNRVIETRQITPDGTLYRIYGYTYPVSGGRNVTHEDLYGRIEMALLLVVYLDEQDRGAIADVAFAMEASEEEFETHG